MEDKKSKFYHYLFKELKVSKNVTRYLESIEVVNTESINTMRLGEDIVISSGRVPLHTDNTERGKDSILLVLASGGHSFLHDNCEIDVQVGSVIRFDGNKLHGLNQTVSNSVFAAIIWDVPKSLGIDDLIWDLKKRLKELKSGYYSLHM